MFSDVVVGSCWCRSYGQTRVAVLIFTADTGWSLQWSSSCVFDNVLNVRPCDLASMLKTCCYTSKFQLVCILLLTLPINWVWTSKTRPQHAAIPIHFVSARQKAYRALCLGVCPQCRHSGIASSPSPDCADCHDAHRHRVLNVQKTCSWQSSLSSAKHRCFSCFTAATAFVRRPT